MNSITTSAARGLAAVALALAPARFRASDLNGEKGGPDHVIESIGALPENLDRL